MAEMVDRVAQALAKADLDENDGMFDYYALTEEVCDRYLALARAAIETMREPTAAMTDAGDLPGWDDSICIGLSAEVWKCMIDAALPSAPAKE